MALPGDLTTATTTFGPYTDAAGAVVLVGKTAKLFPVDPATGKRLNLVHVATGQAVLPEALVVTIGEDGTGSVGPLPHTDNAGLSTVGFAYRVEWDLASSARTASPGNKTFAVPTAAGSAVDFDLLDAADAVPGVLVPVTYGHSAYDLAVGNGFVGTEEEWLASLVGPMGSSVPTGGAGGALSGTYPNPGLNDSTVDQMVAGKVADDTSDTGVALRAASERRGFIAAADYGVLPSTTADSAAALNTLVAAVSAAGGGHIRLSRGTFRLAADILAVPNVTISGAGMGATVLMAEKNAFTFVTGNQAAPIDQFSLRDLTIDGTNMVAGYKGVAMQYLRRCTFENLHIKNTQFTGLGIDYLVDCYIGNVITENTGLGNDGTQPGGNGIGIGIGGFATMEESFLVVGCTAINAKRSGIMIERSGYASPKGAKVIGSYAIGCGDTGFQDAGGCGAIFMGNVASQNVGYGFAINQATIGASGPGYMGQCVNNYAVKNGKAGIIYDASLAAPTGPGYLIANNVCDANAAEGIFLYLNTAAYDVQALSVRGNVVRKNSGSGLRLRGTGTGKFTDITIAENLLFGNGTAGGASVNNLRLDASISGGSIIDNACPADNSLPATSIVTIAGRTFTDVVFRGNTARNAAAKWAKAGTFTTCQILENPGYNPLGPTAVTVTASPFTYTAGSTPEVLYVDGGTVSAIVKGGITLRTATGGSVPLRPNEAVTITYSVAPTLTADRL